ncbi:MAG: carboxy-S-adenosyl-L-methionine synthase CmoA [Anaerolineales bacterium]|nr:carboxy-S-adenosyl-L-methionine synthase CmoA [Anaerolineales bacterium]
MLEIKIRSSQDAIYAAPQAKIHGFAFDENVVRVFPDMIERSVPGYDNIVPMIGLIAARYAQAHSQIYDLGSSLGAATLAMRHAVEACGTAGVGITAVDNSPAMIAKASEILTQDTAVLPVELLEADIQAVPIHNASVVVLNFTLQFVDTAVRPALIQRIYDGLLPGGVLVLSEKVVFPGREKTERFIDLHHDFKRANGYSDLEIAQKRTALENVLIPETIPQHQQRALNAGFATCEVWFQAFNFVSLLAIK